MATTVQDIDALLAVRSESEHLEFKEAANNFHFEELVDYCVALANEGGGRMLLGITAQGAAPSGGHEGLRGAGAHGGGHPRAAASEGDL